MNPKFRAISNAVTNKIGRQGLIIQKHSPGLLFGAGVVGMIGTVVLASRATLKLDALLEDAQQKKTEVIEKVHPNYEDIDRKRDLTVVYTQMAIQVCKLYGPALIVGVASVAALTGSHHILNNRVVGLTAAYNVLDKGFKEYRSRVVSELGTEKDAEFRYGTEEVEVIEEGENGKKVIKTVQQIKGKPSIYARYFDEHSTQWDRTPAYNQMFLRSQQSYANDLLNARGHVFLNEIYDMLGLTRTKEGAVVGWVKGGLSGYTGDGYIDFGVFQGDVFQAMQFVNGEEKSVLLDFNVDGLIYDKI